MAGWTSLEPVDLYRNERFAIRAHAYQIFAGSSSSSPSSSSSASVSALASATRRAAPRLPRPSRQFSQDRQQSNDIPSKCIDFIYPMTPRRSRVVVLPYYPPQDTLPRAFPTASNSERTNLRTRSMPSPLVLLPLITLAPLSPPLLFSVACSRVRSVLALLTLFLSPLLLFIRHSSSFQCIRIYS